MSKKKNVIKDSLIKVWKSYDLMARNSTIDKLEYEAGEMDNIFGLIVLASFIGLPSPPMQITLDLLPDMEKHFVMMLNKVDTAESPISDLLSTFEVI
jgi:hypothetical protein